jgi:P4 family phage/plasmid primase-like protien
MPTASQLYAAGYADLISVIPPEASLIPSSKISLQSRGKVPGRKLLNGQWAGYGWRTHEATSEDIRQWERDGANFGLRAGRFPGLDIDSSDDEIATHIQKLALRVLGPAPVRVGKPPKRLLMYHTEQPFTRMRLWLEDGNKTTHLIELLGEGQQYLVSGIHPATMRPYEWCVAELPTAAELTAITCEQVATLFDHIKRDFEARGWIVHREGDGRRRDRTTAADQNSLLAPSIDELRRAVGLIPNDGEKWASRESYIAMGYAIHAAAGNDGESGFEIFCEWCGRWEGGENTVETVEADWSRMHPPYAIGWDWIARHAREHGYNDAPNEFPAEGAPPPRKRVMYSDRWLADAVIERIGERLRYAPGLKTWLIWTGERWERDELNRPRTEVRELLHEIACDVASAKQARGIESASRLRNVMSVMEADLQVVVAMRALDADPWLLNTPAGVIDLRTACLLPHDRSLLMTKTTRVSVDRVSDCPRWKAFLHEATGQNVELVDYLQRLAGYCLTGLVDEHSVVFVHGPGGNGKSVCLNTLIYILGDYATTAAMSTFMASKSERHPTEVAALHGARLVTASETSEGGRWNEERLKNLTGGDPVTARFLYQDFFTFQPQFKLVLIGNRKPSLDAVDDAMRRRLQLVPFTLKPAHPDPHLTDKLRDEAPAILRWMVDGALAWQAQRLSPPAIVQAATNEYFEDQDMFGRWLDECCEETKESTTSTADLFAAWTQWCGESREFIGSMKRFSQMVADRGFSRTRDSKTGRMGLRGIRLGPQASAMPV